jgi:hypothetical protein
MDADWLSYLLAPTAAKQKPQVSFFNTCGFSQAVFELGD